MRIALASFLVPLVLLVPSGAALAGPGWTLDVDRQEELTRADVESALGGGARRCLGAARFDAKANGYGWLFVLTDRAGEIREAEELVGRYRVTRRLGVGGLGVVDLAHDTLLDREVALKRIKTDDGTDEHRKRLLREGQIAAKLDHPSIARILDCLELGNELVLVLEYVDGETLGKRLRRDKTLPVPLAKHITLAVLDALAHAHRSAVVHRDVKPENVMLTGSSSGSELPGVKLLDFGIAKRLDLADRERLTETGAAVGTLTYMAPEQASGLEVDARADLYGVGATLFAMLCGRPPVRVSSLSELLQSLCNEEPPALEGAADEDAALAAVVRKALARDPKDRFASAEEMRAALVEGGEVTLVAPPVVPMAKKTLARGERRLVALAVAAVVVGVGAWAIHAMSSASPVQRVGDGGASPVLVDPSAALVVSVTPVDAAAPVASERATAAPAASARDAGPPALASSRDAGAVVTASSFSIQVSASGVELDPSGRRALEGGLAACLRRPAFDAAANGFGRLVAHAAPSGEVIDARYLGFDVARPAPSFDPAFERRSRVLFDDLGQCLRAATVGRRLAKPSTDEDREIVVTFSP